MLIRWAILALGVALSAWLVPGITYHDGETLVIVVFLLSFFNAFLKPLLILISLPFIVATLGLGVWLIVWIINALLIYWAAKIVDGFYVHGFGDALLGALIISLTNMFVSRLTKKTKPARPSASGPAKKRDDDVIDI